jgi:hypothetical protein
LSETLGATWNTTGSQVPTKRNGCTRCTKENASGGGVGSLADNRDTVAFEAAAEIITRLANDLDISVRGAVLQLYKERDRIISMGTSLPDDRLPDAGMSPMASRISSA